MPAPELHGSLPGLLRERLRRHGETVLRNEERRGRHEGLANGRRLVVQHGARQQEPQVQKGHQVWQGTRHGCSRQRARGAGDPDEQGGLLAIGQGPWLVHHGHRGRQRHSAETVAKRNAADVVWRHRQHDLGAPLWLPQWRCRDAPAKLGWNNVQGRGYTKVLGGTLAGRDSVPYDVQRLQRHVQTDEHRSGARHHGGH